MRSDGQRDVDLARAEAAGMRDLRMVMDELLSRGMPSAADDFPWPLLMHDGSTILHVNPACLRWLGCKVDGALVGQPLDVLCTPEDRLALLAAVGAGNEGPPPTPHIQRFCTQSGTTLIGRVLSRCKRFGNATATFALVEPGSTDRSSELLRLLGEAVDHLTDIVFITEAQAIDGIGRRIVFVNRAFSESSGFNAAEVLGKTPSITIGDGTDRATLARLETALRETRAVREDLLKYAKDGSPYWVELQIIPVFDESGTHSHWVSIQRDITERKRLESRLLESARLAAAGALSASLASELNSPLASVTSSLEWLSDRVPALLDQLGDRAQPEVKEVLEALTDARIGASRVASATSYLHLLASAAPAQRQVVRIEELLDAAVGEAERQLGTKVPLEQRCESGLLVAADPSRLAHALRLTVMNAMLAGRSQRKVRLQLTGALTRVLLVVDDDGPGIDPEMAGELSSPFGSRKPQGIGDALALFVASRLIAELEGELVLIPRIDGGTRVEIRLPRDS
ncbi:MAG TPA: PAS domain-containing protein [Polyangiaceae bacterium]|nr:PAS domain-containing protein [Polyangiaceae bacterium]